VRAASDRRSDISSPWLLILSTSVGDYVARTEGGRPAITRVGARRDQDQTGGPLAIATIAGVSPRGSVRRSRFGKDLGATAAQGPKQSPIAA
jgi:hypothetical protein